MTQEIAVVGAPEFTTGFRLAGVRKFENVPETEKDESLDAAVERVFEDGDVGIVVMHAEDVDYLSRNVRERVETSVEPTVVLLGSEEAGGTGLRDQIRRAIGIDLMAAENEEGE